MSECRVLYMWMSQSPRLVFNFTGVSEALTVNKYSHRALLTFPLTLTNCLQDTSKDTIQFCCVTVKMRHPAKPCIEQLPVARAKTMKGKYCHSICCEDTIN